MADKCRFTHPQNSPDVKPRSPQDVERKRARSFDGDGGEHVESNGAGDQVVDAAAAVDAAYGADGEDTLGLEAIGYMAAPLLARLGIEVKVRSLAVKLAGL